MADSKDIEGGTSEVFVQIEKAALSGKVADHAARGDDETARYAAAPIEIDATTNKRLFWKINRRILSVMLVTYFCQSLDKGTLGFSSIMGIKKDAHLVGQDVRISDALSSS